MVGAGENGHALGVPKLCGGDVQHELVRARLHTLGEHENGHVGRDVGRERVADLAQVRGRQGQDHGLHGANRRGRVARGDDVAWQLVAREVTRVPARCVDDRRHLGAAAPEPHLCGLAGHEAGEGCPPRARAHDAGRGKPGRH